jgi:hypothetical protein
MKTPSTTKVDKQPRRASKDVSVDKLHPASDMGKRAKGGDKVSNQGLPSRKKSSGVSSTPAKKPARP